jgi:hypothetical protein
VTTRTQSTEDDDMTTTIDTSSDTRRQYWQGVLDGAGNTTVPRWCTTPMLAIGEHSQPLPPSAAALLEIPARAFSAARRTCGQRLVRVHGASS